MKRKIAAMLLGAVFSVQCICVSAAGVYAADIVLPPDCIEMPAENTDTNKNIVTVSDTPAVTTTAAVSEEAPPVTLKPDIPLSGSYNLTIRVADIMTEKNIEGLDCELFVYQTGEIIASWNTSDEPEKYVENLEYSFDSYDSYHGNITYSIRIPNMPEEYLFFYGKMRDCYGVAGSSIYEFTEGTEVDTTVYLIDTSDDAPEYTYVTSSDTPAAVSTTTTTAASAVSYDLNDDGVFSVADAVMLQGYIAKKIEISENVLKRADMNGDGRVNVFDLVSMKRKLIGEISAPPAAEINPESWLREKYPEYFGLTASKGLEVYVFQYAPDNYSCALAEGTNRHKNYEEIAELFSNSASVDHMKAILSYYDIPENDIFIIPWQDHNCEYSFKIDEEYIEKIREMFFGKSETINPSFDPAEIVSVNVSTSFNDEHYKRSYTSDENIKNIISCLNGLNLKKDFPENPDEYDGMCWIVELNLKNGEKKNVYLFSMFYREDDGAWLKMRYSESEEFEKFVYYTPSDKNDSDIFISDEVGFKPMTRTTQRLALWCRSFYNTGEKITIDTAIGDGYSFNKEKGYQPDYDTFGTNGHPEYEIYVCEKVKYQKIDDDRIIINGSQSSYKKEYTLEDMGSLDISGKYGDYDSYRHETAELDLSAYKPGDSVDMIFSFVWRFDGENPNNPSSDISGESHILGFYVGEKGIAFSSTGSETARNYYMSLYGDTDEKEPPECKLNKNVYSLEELDMLKSSSITSDMEFLDLAESLPVPVIKNSEIKWINHTIGISKDNENLYDVAYVTLGLPDEEWVRLEYTLDKEDSETAIKRVLADTDFDVTVYETPVVSRDGKIKVYAESVQKHASGSGNIIRWFVDYDGMFIQVFYKCGSAENTDISKMIDSLKIVSIGDLIIPIRLCIGE